MPRQRTPQTRSRSKRDLGDSWVVENEENEENEDSISEESSDSPVSSQEAPSEKNRKAPTVKGVAETRRTSSPSVTPTSGETPTSSDVPRKRWPTTTTLTGSEPELIMPRIHEEHASKSQADTRRRRVPEQQPPQFRRTRDHAIRPRSGPESHDELLTASESIVRILLTASEGIVRILKPIFGYIFEVLGGAFRALKAPISYALAIYVLFGLMVFTRNLVTTSIFSAISPICRIPGSSLLNLPMCKPPMAVNYKGEKTPPVEFDQLMGTQSKFEEILERTAEGISLPLDMKRSEASIRDLRQVVKYSQLHFKNELVYEFDGFIETARIASYNLQKFTSHVGRSVDNVLATAKWTTRVIEGIAERDSSRGAVASFISNKFLAPFQPLKFTEDAILDQYMQHTRTVEEEIKRLIDEALALLMVLENLNNRLDVIHGISIRGGQQAKVSKDEVLSELWTMLGGNRSKLGKVDSELKLLQQVNTYKENALGYVAGTVLKLQAMQTELEALRERVGSVHKLPDKAHVPLSVHIENIRLGVERLEIGRSNSRRLENDYLMKRLDGGEENFEKPRIVDVTLR